MKNQNLSKELKNRVKETNCPIHNELIEQLESSRSNRFFINLRQTSKNEKNNELHKMF